MRRVVVTGLGAITPIGNNVSDFWHGIKNGACGVDTITHFDASEFKTQIAGEVKNFDVTEFIEQKEARKMDRYTQFAVVAAEEAVKNAGLDMTKEDPWKVFAYGDNSAGVCQIGIDITANFFRGCICINR